MGRSAQAGAATGAATRTAEEVLADLGSRPAGLTDQEAAARREQGGANVVRLRRVSALAVLGRQFRNAVLLMLLATAVLAAVLGDVTDAVVIAVILAASVLLGFANEYAAERSTARLCTSLTQSAVVVRAGAARTVAATELVAGDVVELTPGCRVPADLRLLAATGLTCDESTLTGESLPAEKGTAPVPPGTPVGDQASMAWLGTIVRAGVGRGVVVATGDRTRLGTLAQRLDTRAPETAFQAGLRRFSLLLVYVAVALVATILVTGVLLGRPLVDSVLFALAIAVGITPQLLPAVVNTSLAAGARRLAAARVLVKRLVCIEDIGNVQVLVTDKTGTLTTGSITLTGAVGPAGGEDRGLVALAAAATSGGGGGSTTDALDAALVAAAPGPRAPEPVAVLPFDHERRLSSALVALPGAAGTTLVTKGAPEAVLARCRAVPDAAGSVAQSWLDRGARVIAVATRPAPGATTLTPADEADLTLAGFLVFADPPREDAGPALRRLEDLHVDVVVATGDHPAVAAEVAHTLGLGTGAPLVGADVDALDDAALRAAVLRARIVARVSPEQKERLVRVLRGGGTTVGFLGDGVNDALALHAADVGISVDTATDVAKDAADVVLLEKSLDVIADGVAEGRRIFANTLKYVFMAASGNFGNMISAAAASVFLPFLPMLPGQILLGNLLYDASQLTISTDRVDPPQLARPAHWDLAMIRRFMLVFGPLSSVFDLLTFALLIGVFHAGETLFHTGWFMESLASQALVVLVIRTRVVPFVRSRASGALVASLVAVVVVAVALPFSPLAGVLGFTRPPLSLLAALAVVVVAYLAVADLTKWLFFRAEERADPPADPSRGHARRVHRALASFSPST